MVADFLLNVVCLLSAVTIYSSKPIILNGLLILPALAIFALPGKAKSNKHTAKPTHANADPKDQPLEPLPIRPFVTAYRGTMMIVTCLAILAVDFRVFPRRFAKVETWGTSLMDMGVGSFVFSAGLVAARPIIQTRISGQQSSLVNQLKAASRVCLPLLILGLVRLYSVKGLDYAEHVTEYGVHWNFFFTLAFLPPFAAILQPLLTKVHPLVIAVFLSATYQLLLDKTSLKAYALTAPRTNFIAQNREGLLSFAGYLTIFLSGQAMGLQILPRNPKASSKDPTPSEQKRRMLSDLVVQSVLWTSFFLFTISYNYGLGLQVSRRLANLPYVAWVVAFNCTQLLAFYAIEALAFPNLLSSKARDVERKECDRATSRVIKAYNRNGLALFLLANLLTGLVNMTFDTLRIGHQEAVALLTAYALTVTAVALALDMWNISVKL